MKTKLVLSAMLVVLSQFGCTQAPVGGSPCDDPDEDGFCNLPEPEGVDATRRIAVAVESKLSKQQWINASPGQVPGFANQLEIKMRLSVALTYENGEVVPYSRTQSLGRFTIQLEAVCPQTIEVGVSVRVEIPLVGPQTVFSDTMTFVRGGAAGENSFECDQLIRVTAGDETTGEPDFAFATEPLPVE